MNILHIIENLDKGAVENWLIRTFIESKKYYPNWDWTFFCILGKNGRLDEKVLSAGGQIIYSPVSISNKIEFLLYLRKTLKQKKYDIIHAHHDYLSGFYLWATIGLKFKKRILHIHNTDKALPVSSRLTEKILLWPCWLSAIVFNDLIIGISNNTLKKFLPPKIPKQSLVLYYGVDFSKFTAPLKSNIRNELGLNQASKIIIFIGRLNDLKNPIFLIPLIEQIHKRNPNVHLIIVGEGTQKAKIEELALQKDLCDNVHLLGWRNDIEDLLKQADLFIFPRKEYPKEGLGLVVIEAQASGIPMIITQGIVEDAIVIKNNIEVIALKEPLDKWVKTAEHFLLKKQKSPQQALLQMKKSPYGLKIATQNLIQIYKN